MLTRAEGQAQGAPVHYSPFFHRTATDLAIASVHNNRILVPAFPASYNTKPALIRGVKHALHHAETTAGAGPHAAIQSAHRTPRDRIRLPPEV